MESSHNIGLPNPPAALEYIREPRLLRSSDSGYASYDPSPEKPRAAGNPRTPRSARIIDLYDGNGSVDSPSSDKDEALPPTPTRSQQQQKGAGLPSGREDQSKPVEWQGSWAHFAHAEAARKEAARRVCSAKTPDRFVPVRDHSVSSSEKFKSTKKPSELNPAERLVRHEDDAPDAFVFTRRSASAAPVQSTSPERPNNTVRSGTVLSPAENTDGGGAERQVSNGSVWAVGGLAPSIEALDDGHGGLIQSGTNARLVRTPLSTAKARSEEDREKHEARLATALEIDRAQRILEFDTFSTAVRSRSRNGVSSDHAGPRNEASHVRPATRKRPRDKTYFDGAMWRKDTRVPIPPAEERSLPIAPFKVLDAPNLRDDYYCSIIAYSPTCHALAIGLGYDLYSWSESSGVFFLGHGSPDTSWITSVDFSSAEGKKSILAFGRANGQLTLMSLYDSLYPRFVVKQAGPVACVKWRPTVTVRPSRSPITPGVPVNNEDLLVGDDAGNVYYYAVEWPASWEVARDCWRGSMVLLAKISVHTQQIYGISWSPDGNMFATGGNDNLCCLFEVEKVLGGEEQQDMDEEEYDRTERERSSTVELEDRLYALTPPDPVHGWQHHVVQEYPPPLTQLPSASPAPSTSPAGDLDLPVISLPMPTEHRLFDVGNSSQSRRGMLGADDIHTRWPEYASPRNRYPGDRDEHGDRKFLSDIRPDPSQSATPSLSEPLPRLLDAGSEKHVWTHTAAVKAIAFCPWQDSLVATGGGSNDKCIHFFHTTSGAALATIAVHAQVTSLIWSTTRREIVATFGYAQPEHPYRIAVFSWPECKQVAAVPWESREYRALYAISYPAPPTEHDLQPVETGQSGYYTREEQRQRAYRKAAKGCIVVAASDKTVKFHEIWPAEKKVATGGLSIFDSEILKEIQGIDKEGEIIR